MKDDFIFKKKATKNFQEPRFHRQKDPQILITKDPKGRETKALNKKEKEDFVKHEIKKQKFEKTKRIQINY